MPKLHEEKRRIGASSILPLFEAQIYSTRKFCSTRKSGGKIKSIPALSGVRSGRKAVRTPEEAGMLIKFKRFLSGEPACLSGVRLTRRLPDTPRIRMTRA